MTNFLCRYKVKPKSLFSPAWFYDSEHVHYILVKMREWQIVSSLLVVLSSCQYVYIHICLCKMVGWSFFHMCLCIMVGWSFFIGRNVDISVNDVNGIILLWLYLKVQHISSAEVGRLHRLALSDSSRLQVLCSWSSVFLSCQNWRWQAIHKVKCLNCFCSPDMYTFKCMDVL